ncbi:MAG: glycoside hydrolase family 28 protein [Saprospiraceae bacterium]
MKIITVNQRCFLLKYCCLLMFFFTACHKGVSPTNSTTVSVEKKSQLVKDIEAIFYAPNFAPIPNKIFNAADYGAVGDGQTLNTIAIQKTIDAAAKAGGGQVVFPKGIYVSGALFIKSNVDLHLAEGVVIQAIQEDKHFPDKWTRVAGIEMNWPAGLINIYDEKNVRVTGKGIIDGNGKFWWDKFWGDPQRTGGMWVDYTERGIRWAVDYDCKRVRAVVVYNSEAVVLKDFTVKRSGFWTISLTYSNKVHVDGLIIRNNIGGIGPSSDGINSDSSKDILVENCDIDCNDDNLCIKAGRDSDGLRVNRPSENIVYRNCITRAGHGLFTIGSETSGGMHNIEVYGLEAIGTSTGIRFKSAKVRGGLIENIWFHDIKMKAVKKPFQFELNWYPSYSYPVIPASEMTADMPIHWKVMTTPVEPPEKGIPEFRNIRLSNIEVKEAERAFYANAYPEMPIHHLTWENISIEAQEGGSLNHAANWTMKNVQLTTRTNQALVLKNSSNVALPKWSHQSMSAAPSTNIKPNKEHTVPTKKAISEGLVLINPTVEGPIAAKDTTTFSKEMLLHIQNETAKTLMVYEPLGDGFYFSPLTIRKDGNSLKINSERNHIWKIHIAAAAKPQYITGVDSWNYDETQQQIIAQKEGMQFEILIAE